MTGYILADPVSGAPAFTGSMFRMLLGTLGQSKNTRSLGNLSGIHPGTPDGFVTADTSTWSVGAHRGMLDLETSLTAGAYEYVFDAAVTGSLTPPDATHDRIDLLSVRLDDPSQGDGSSVPLPVIVYTNGTPASSPAAPATPTRSLALAQILVSPGGAPAVTEVASFLSAASGIQRTRGGRPTGPYIGQYVDDPTVGMCRWNGANWVPVLQVGTTLATISSGTNVHTGTTSFPVPYLAAPKVFGQMFTTPQRNIGVQVTAATTTDFSWVVYRTDGTNAGTDQLANFNWHAIGL